jgi:hypothetical protein
MCVLKAECAFDGYIPQCGWADVKQNFSTTWDHNVIAHAGKAVRIVII